MSIQDAACHLAYFPVRVEGVLRDGLPSETCRFSSSLAMRRRTLSADSRSCCSGDWLKMPLARSYRRNRELLSMPRRFRRANASVSFAMGRLSFRHGVDVGCGEGERGPDPEFGQAGGSGLAGQLALEG